MTTSLLLKLSLTFTLFMWVFMFFGYFTDAHKNKGKYFDILLKTIAVMMISSVVLWTLTILAFIWI